MHTYHFGASNVESLHGQKEALANFTQNVLLGDDHVFKSNGTGIRCPANAF